MSRVLLLLDDYSEMTFIQIFLKKLGFDVDVLQNPHILGDRLMAFRPQILLLTEDSKKYVTEAILKTAMSQVSEVKVILLKQGKSKGVDLLTPEIRRIGSPVQHIELIEACAQSSNVPSDGLIDKFNKIKGQLPLTQEQKKLFGISDSEESGELENETKPLSAEEREERFKDYLAKNPEEVNGIMSAKDVHAVTRAERALSASSEASKKVDVQRRNFVKELFKKGKG